VRRLVGLVVHNWPLKVAAVVLATMLYVGFVVSQSVVEFPGTIQIVAVNTPANAFLTATLPQATNIQYVALGDASARASTESFRATVDLADVDPAAGPTLVSVRVESVDPRFQVVDWEPHQVQVTLDPLKTRTGIPVHVIIASPTPSGLDVRQPVYDPQTASVTGLASVVDRVVEVQANVTIEPSGLDVDRQVELIPVDGVGNRLTPVDVDPTTAHVRIAVFKHAESRPLPVTPVVTGTPAAGYEVTGIKVNPLIVSVEGDADAILGLSEAPTDPVTVNGATQSVTQSVGLALPVGVQPAGGADVTVRVTVSIQPVAGSRSFQAGIVPTGVEAGLEYDLSTTQAIALVGGSLADLDRLDPAEFVIQAPVGGLAPGVHEVALTAYLPVGLTLVSVTPPTVTVTVTVASAASPAPSASP
jgi:YbbR domain-containing protein